jgi:pyruvate/2-oxoglutarate dehydrogenase complex dihydrolipoamide acyltransferase (E2) component
VSTPSGFHWEGNDRYFHAMRKLCDYELGPKPGITVSFFAEVDLTEVEELREEAGDLRPSYTALVVKALALALVEFPYANRRLCRRGIWPFRRTRLQAFDRSDIAVAAERVVPGIEYVAFIDVLRAAETLSLAEIDRWCRELATSDAETNEQWRTFSTVITRLPVWLSTLLIRIPNFVPSQWERYRGGAAMISSPAKYGIDAVSTTWPHPIGVSFGMVRERPIVRDGEVVAAPTFTLFLNFDRRVMVGAPAARFFARIVEILEHAHAELTADVPAFA